MIADQFNSDGSVYLKVLVNPLVNLIWLAGLVFLLGSLVTMWPDAREQRRLARPLRRGRSAGTRLMIDRQSRHADYRPTIC